MATNKWIGGSPVKGSVAQVAEATITGYDTGTTYKVTIGGVVISQVGTGGTTNTTAVALVALLNASTHPYFSGVTWTAPGAGVIHGVADTAGVPYLASLTKSGGTGTVTTFADTTANAGPNDYNTVANWELGAIPVNGDDVVFDFCAYDCIYGLDQTGVTPNSVRVTSAFLNSNKLGLQPTAFATSANGQSTSNVDEYRQKYLLYTAVTLGIDIGETPGLITPAGAWRCKIQTVNATAFRVLNTGATGSETGKLAVYLLTASATSTIEVRNAPGGVGIAADYPGETTTVGTVSVTDKSSISRVMGGPGVTYTTWTQAGGNNRLDTTAATLPTINADGGLLETVGTGAVTTLNATGANVQSKHSGTTTAAIASGKGVIDFSGSTAARTVTTLTRKPGGTIKGLNTGNITLTNPLVCAQGCTISD